MVRPGVDAVLLDVDDTLVDTRACFRAGTQAVARAYLGHLGPAGPAAALEHWVDDRDGCFARFAAGELGFLEQRRLRAEAMHRDLGGPALDGDGFARWNGIYEAAFRRAWAPLPGAVDLVAALVASGTALGAVTNAQVAYQVEKLDRTGLGALPVLVGTDTLGMGKPSPEVFRHACALLGTAPGRTVYVGNDQRVDALGALAAGLQAVWLDHQLPATRASAGDADCPPAGVLVARSLAEVHRWLGLPEPDLGPGPRDR